MADRDPKPKPEKPPACQVPHYSAETREAYGYMIQVLFTDDEDARDAALAWLGKMVHCDLSGELRGPMGPPPWDRDGPLEEVPT
jgi:hypothetical protein